jgi:hypothetical protein
MFLVVVSDYDMLCLTPIRLKNPNYSKKPNQSLFLDVPCGKCSACISSHRSLWCWRLQQERKASTSCFFITLTYNDDNIPVDRETGEIHLEKRDVQKWLKRVRKWYPNENIRYYLVGEYGDNTHRPHYHCLLFNLPLDLEPARKFIEGTWSLGNIQIGYCSDGGIGYVTKYMLKNIIYSSEDYNDVITYLSDEYHVPYYKAQQIYKDLKKEKDLFPPFMLCSRKPLIGYRYIEKFRQWHLDNPSRTSALTLNGAHVRLPDSFVNHIFKDNELQKDAFKRNRKSYGLAAERILRNEYSYYLQQESMLGSDVDWSELFPDGSDVSARTLALMRSKIRRNKSRSNF